MTWYSTLEFNIFRRARDRYELIATDGTAAEVDREAALLLLSLPGTRADGLAALLARHGVDGPDPGILEELEAIGFLARSAGPVRRPFSLERALANVDAVAEGPLTLQELSITLSDACPLDCAYCFRKAGGVSGALDRRTVAACILDLARLAGLSLTLSGGEPALFADEVAYAAAFARETGITEVAVNSSGVGLDAKVARLWRDEGVRTINLSFDTLDPARSRELLGRDGGVEAARAALDASLAAGLAVHVNLTLSPGAAEEIETFAPLLSHPGVTMRVNPCVPLTGRPGLAVSEVRRAWEAVERMRARGLPIYTPIDPGEAYGECFVCSAAITRATVENDGSVGGCQFLMAGHGPRGNVKKEGLYDLWTRGDFGPFRDRSRRPLDRCRRCPERAFCVSHCLAMHERMAWDPANCPRGV